MKIGLDVSQTCVEVAGCGWIAYNIAEALSKLTDDSKEVILYHHFGDWINDQTKSGFYPSVPNVSCPMFDLDPGAARQIWKEVELKKISLPGSPDITHSHNFSAPDIRNCPLVYTVHDLAFWDIPSATTEKNRLLCQNGVLKSLKCADAFVFPSEFTRSRFFDFFEDLLENNQQLNAVVPWAGRFPAVKQPKQFNSDAPWLFVGSLDPRKNIRNILHAFEQYREKSKFGRNLIIAGLRGWKMDFESNHIASLTRRGWINHLGYINDSFLVKLYKEALALVWPSFYEGFGLPIVEAMSQGTPVITSNLTSLPEVGGAAAIYCNPHSIDSIADAMIRLEENESQYSALSKDSLQQSQKFSWEKTAIDLVNFYKEVLSTR